MDIILLLKTILLGIVEGITEWLPISSTGHLILADEFIKLNMTADFKEMFDVVIQLGAIMAVVVLYFHKLNPFSPKKNHEEKMDTIILWTKVILAVFPAAIIGNLFDDWLNDHFYNPPVVAAMLIIYGVLFIIIENRNKRSRRHRVREFRLFPMTEWSIMPIQICTFPLITVRWVRSWHRHLSMHFLREEMSL